MTVYKRKLHCQRVWWHQCRPMYCTSSTDRGQHITNGNSPKTAIHLLLVSSPQWVPFNDPSWVLGPTWDSKHPSRHLPKKTAWRKPPRSWVAKIHCNFTLGIWFLLKALATSLSAKTLAAAPMEFDTWLRKKWEVYTPESNQRRYESENTPWKKRDIYKTSNFWLPCQFSEV